MYKNVKNDLSDFIVWWHYTMPTNWFRILWRIIVSLNDTLSITSLIINFFVPWRRDNSRVGKVMGIIIRIIYIPIASFILLFIVLIALSLILLWEVSLVILFALSVFIIAI